MSSGGKRKNSGRKKLPENKKKTNRIMIRLDDENFHNFMKIEGDDNTKKFMNIFEYYLKNSPPNFM
jgi:hypothetical protein